MSKAGSYAKGDILVASAADSQWKHENLATVVGRTTADGGVSLNNLNNVSIGTAAAGHILQRNSGNTAWENVALSTAVGTAIGSTNASGLSDVRYDPAIGSAVPTKNNFLVRKDDSTNGSRWENIAGPAAVASKDTDYFVRIDSSGDLTWQAYSAPDIPSATTVSDMLHLILVKEIYGIKQVVSLTLLDYSYTIQITSKTQQSAHG